MGRTAREGHARTLPSPNRWDQFCAALSAEKAADGTMLKDAGGLLPLVLRRRKPRGQ